MFSANFPLFERGRLLKIEMLEALRDFPRDLLKVYLKGYSNGVLTGCEIDTKEQYIVIKPGIIFFNEVLYVLKEPYLLPYLSNNRLTLLKVNCLDQDKEKDFIRYITQIYLDYNVTCKETEIELCRFKLKDGARLRSQYRDFYDYNTEYDTVSRVYVPYISHSDTTLVPQIIITFAQTALECTQLEAYDIQFCFLALQHQGVIEKSVLLAYLKIKDIFVSEDANNEELYEGLMTILTGIQNGGKRKKRQDFSGGIWID